MARWEEEKRKRGRKRGRKLAPTRSTSTQVFSYIFTHTVNPTYLKVMRYFKPRSLAPAASVSEGAAHSSRLPTRPWQCGRGRVVPRICVTSQGAGTGTGHQPLFPCAPQPGRVRCLVRPCRSHLPHCPSRAGSDPVGAANGIFPFLLLQPSCSKGPWEVGTRQQKASNMAPNPAINNLLSTARFYSLPLTFLQQT